MAMATTNKFDLTLLEDLITDAESGIHTLSPATIQLCLMGLNDRAIYRGAWWDGGEKITTARWDVAQAHVDQAKQEIILPAAEIDGGGAAG